MMSNWIEKQLNTLNIVLDSQNPRIDVTPTTTQKKIIQQLVRHENIKELSKGIVNYSGL